MSILALRELSGTLPRLIPKTGYYWCARAGRIYYVISVEYEEPMMSIGEGLAILFSQKGGGLVFPALYYGESHSEVLMGANAEERERRKWSV